MMRVTVSNDGKGKHQSFTARMMFAANLSSMFSIPEIVLEGWGSTENEALNNLCDAWSIFRTNTSVAPKQYWEIEYVNGLGEPIAKDW